MTRDYRYTKTILLIVMNICEEEINSALLLERFLEDQLTVF